MDRHPTLCTNNLMSWPHGKLNKAKHIVAILLLENDLVWVQPLQLIYPITAAKV